MINCKETRELLSLYMDNMLTDSQMKSVKDHLAFCCACEKEYLELLEIKELLADIKDEPVPAEFDYRLRAALREESRNSGKTSAVFGGKKKFSYKRLSAIAAVFVVGIFAIAMYNNSSQFENEQMALSSIQPRDYSYEDKDKEADYDSNVAGDSSIASDKSMAVTESIDLTTEEFTASKDSLDMAVSSFDSDVQGFEYYLDMIEKDLKGIAFTVISQEKESSGVYSFVIRLDIGAASEAGYEYRLYKGLEGSIKWETISQ